MEKCFCAFSFYNFFCNFLFCDFLFCDFLFCAIFLCFCYLADDVVVRVGLLEFVELLMVITPVIQRKVELQSWARVHVVGHAKISVVGDSNVLAPLDDPLNVLVLHMVIRATLLPKLDNLLDRLVSRREDFVLCELGRLGCLLLGLLHEGDDQLATLLVAGIGDVLAGSGNPDPHQLHSRRVLLRVLAAVHLDAHDLVVLLQLGLTILGRPEDLVRLHRHAVAPSVGAIVAAGGGGGRLLAEDSLDHLAALLEARLGGALVIGSDSDLDHLDTILGNRVVPTVDPDALDSLDSPEFLLPVLGRPEDLIAIDLDCVAAVEHVYWLGLAACALG
jgi:hypothetical protein